MTQFPSSGGVNSRNRSWERVKACCDLELFSWNDNEFEDGLKPEALGSLLVRGARVVWGGG